MSDNRGRKIKGSEFTDVDKVGVGGVKVSGADYQTVKDYLFEKGKENGERIPFGKFASNVVSVIAEDIRNGKPMKRYLEK